VLADPGLYNALGLTFLIMLASWLVQTPISLLLGVFTAGSQRYRAALAVLYFLPLLLSSAAVAIAFKALLDPNFGLATGLGLPFLAQDWLGVPHLAVGLVIFVIAWQFVPFHTLIYQGGVRQIPKSLYEAAEIDGAGTIKQFFHITLPQLKYTIITSSTLMVVGSLTYFDLIFVLTGGGPGNATTFLSQYLTQKAVGQFDLGPAAAFSLIYFLIILLLCFVLYNWMQRVGTAAKSAGSAP
jgi:raffinose/stachyose/melibiose transport system permease protein